MERNGDGLGDFKFRIRQLQKQNADPSPLKRVRDDSVRRYF
jgi:hypothetical protein